MIIEKSSETFVKRLSIYESVQKYYKQSIPLLELEKKEEEEVYLEDLKIAGFLKQPFDSSYLFPS